MNNPILNMAMNMLQNKNPQAFNMVSQAMRAGSNPQDMLKQIIGGKNTEQIQQVLSQAKSMGCPDEILTQIQNLK
jgi:hypothetical protein